MKRPLPNDRTGGKKLKSAHASAQEANRNAQRAALRMQLLHLEQRVAASPHLSAADQRALYQQMSALRYALHKLS